METLYQSIPAVGFKVNYYLNPTPYAFLCQHLIFRHLNSRGIDNPVDESQGTTKDSSISNWNAYLYESGWLFLRTVQYNPNKYWFWPHLVCGYILVLSPGLLIFFKKYKFDYKRFLKILFIWKSVVTKLFKFCKNVASKDANKTYFSPSLTIYRFFSRRLKRRTVDLFKKKNNFFRINLL